MLTDSDCNQWDPSSSN